MKKFVFPVDVDNPKFKSKVEPIDAHSKIAEFYKFRPPYLKDFFHQSSEKVGLLNSDCLLDLCCGRGEIASGFSEYVQKILAIDGSREMLDNAIERENINYFNIDVNNQPLPFVKEVNHITIGSAIHWITSSALKEIILSNLHPAGKVFISHTLFKYDNQPYADALRKLNTRYGRSDGAVDLWGVDKLSASGFSPVNQVRVIKNVIFDMNFFYQNHLSYAYSDFYKIISTDVDNYRQEFFDTLKPFLLNGRLSASLVNWGVVYSRN